MEPTSVLSAIGLAMGASWASGRRLYACVATLGTLQYFHLAQLPGSLDLLGRPAVWGTAAVLMLVEFLADKVPWVDSTWTTVHGFVRLPAAAIMAGAAFTKISPEAVVIAGLLGGGIAMTSYSGHAVRRLAINHSPEPVSNWVVSATEDVGGYVYPLLGAFLPALAVVAVCCAIALTVVSFLVWKKLRVSVGGWFRRMRGEGHASDQGSG